MNLVDTNIWLALVLPKHIFHAAARTWLDARTQTRELLFCRSTQQSFLRLLTTAAVLKPYGSLPLSNAEAWQVYERFLADNRIGMAEEPAGLEGHWKSLAVLATSSPKVWMDAYLAAFAIAGGYQFVTTDQAFANYNGLNLLTLS